MKKLLVIIPFSFVCFHAFSQKLPGISSMEECSIGKTFNINSADLDQKGILNCYLPFEFMEAIHKKYQVSALSEGLAEEDFIPISRIAKDLYLKIKTINKPYITSEFDFLEQKSLDDALQLAAYNTLE